MKSVKQAFGALGSWWLDVKLGMRMLIKYPGLALCGGAGIAVAVAIAAGGFSVIQGNFLASSLPLDEGDRIVSIELWDSARGKPERRSLHDFHIWRDGLRSVQEISAFRTVTLNLIAPGTAPESIRAAAMSASGFGVARVRPLLGRSLAIADEQPGAPPAVVIGENVWRTRFASDSAILGRTIRLGATPHSIVGVMPESFAFPVNHRFWVPLRTGLAPPEPLSGPELTVFGRLAPGASLASAQAELSATAKRTALEFPNLYAPLRPQVAPYPQPILGFHGTEDLAGLFAMQGLIVSLLVLVCLNVAILVYTRTAMRHAEIGLRTALGASRGRIVAQLFVEALVLSVVAAAVGAAAAALALRQVTAVTRPIAADLPFWLTFRLSPEAVSYACALGVLAALIVGVVPGLQATRGHVQSGLRVVGAGGSRMQFGRIWTALIVAQAAFAVALLPPSVFNAWENLRSGWAGPGFAANEFLSAQLGRDSEANSSALGVEEVVHRIEAEPGIAGVTFALAQPGDEPGARIEVESASAAVHRVRFNRVAVNFFRTFGVPVLAGRGFIPADIAPDAAGAQPQSGAIVVNRPFAERVFGGNALGRRIRYTGGANSEPGPWYEIAGVVSDFPTGVSPGMEDSDWKIYHPVSARQLQPAAIALRMHRIAPAAASQRLREIAAAVDPELYLRDVRTLDENLRREQWINRLEAAVLLAVTLSVLLLSSAGIYALMSFTVSQRRREIGIRIALGAPRARIVSGIFSRALLQISAGAALGAAAGLAFDRASGGDLMRGNAGIVMPAVALVMMMAGLLAARGPVRRSLRVQPAEALREQ